jgi:hypothetical protein
MVTTTITAMAPLRRRLGDEAVKGVSVKDLKAAEEKSYSQNILYLAPALT